MSDMPNYYQILGIEPGADDLQIKNAFRAIAKQIKPNDPRARTLKEAYEILTDPQKRSYYDAHLVKSRGVTQTVRAVDAESKPRSNGATSGAAQWEYLTLKSSRNYGTTKYYINDENQRELKNARFSQVINMIGEDGWEMVGISTMGNEQTYVFKRAVE